MYMILRAWHRASATAATKTPHTRRSIHSARPYPSRQRRRGRRIRTLSFMPRLLHFHNASLFFMLSGITEAICYRHYHVNINLMTGNTIRCIDALANGKYPEFIFLSSVIIWYIVGGILFKKLLSWRISKKPSMPTSTGLGILPSIPHGSANANANTNTHIFRKHSMTSKIPNSSGQVSVSAFSFILFAISDWVGYVMGDKFKIPLLAMAFGVTNAVAYHMFGYVTHSVTGTYDAIGRLCRNTSDVTARVRQKYKLEDDFVTNRESNVIESATTHPNHVNAAATPSSSGSGSSGSSRNSKAIAEELCAFFMGLLLTFLLSNSLERRPNLYAILPPLGISLGFTHVVFFSLLFSHRNSNSHVRTVEEHIVSPSNRIILGV